MAYNVYFACDGCGDEGMSWINHMVPYGRCQEYARRMGWKIGKCGWICPECQKKQEEAHHCEATYGAVIALVGAQPTHDRLQERCEEYV